MLEARVLGCVLRQRPSGSAQCPLRAQVGAQPYHWCFLGAVHSFLVNLVA